MMIHHGANYLAVHHDTGTKLHIEARIFVLRVSLYDYKVQYMFIKNLQLTHFGLRC